MLVIRIMTEMVCVPAAALLLYAALHDLASRTVPNWLPASLFGLGILMRLLDHSLLTGLLVCGLAFAALYGLWLLRAVGGGDVKLWAAATLLIPPLPQPQLDFLAGVVVLGGFLALLYLGLGLLLPKPAAQPPASPQAGLLRRAARIEIRRISRRAPLPYALAISASALMSLLPLTFRP
jgi:prepilin peptidase CpaA